MKTVDIFAIKGMAKKDDKAMLSCNRSGIEMVIDEFGRVYNEGGQYIANAEEVESGSGAGCNTHGGLRSGSGRPLANDPRKSRHIKFTDSEWETIREAAAASNVTMSDYVRKKTLN